MAVADLGSEPARRFLVDDAVSSLARAAPGLDFNPKMKTSIDESSTDPAVHSAHLQQEISGLIDHLRRDVARAPEPQFQALLETSAEVLGGLRKAFEDYARHSEPAWRDSGGPSS